MLFQSFRLWILVSEFPPPEVFLVVELIEQLIDELPLSMYEGPKFPILVMRSLCPQ